MELLDPLDKRYKGKWAVTVAKSTVNEEEIKQKRALVNNETRKQHNWHSSIRDKIVLEHVRGHTLP